VAGGDLLDGQRALAGRLAQAHDGCLALGVRRAGHDLKTDRPGKVASAPSCSSMRSSWLYFATRSERDGAPVLIWPQPVATARSAIVVSSVSPERWLITAV